MQILEQINHIYNSSSRILPELLLLFGFVVFVIIDLIWHRRTPNFLYHICVALVLFAIYASLLEFKILQQHASFGKLKDSFLFNKNLFQDPKASFFKISIASTTFLVLLHFLAFPKARWQAQLRVPEFFMMLLAVVIGLFFLTMTVSFISLFVVIELVSISSYVLVAMPKQKENLQAAIQYLIFGATSSAVMLYGFSLLFGMTGTMTFVEPVFSGHLSGHGALLVFVASLMAMGGLLFKLAAVPFHVWTPEVYAATPSPVLAFLSVVPKIGALLAMMRLTSVLQTRDATALIGIVAASLLIGNFSALWQTNVKKILAYSSIAHAGFMLVGLCAVSETGMKAATFYVVTYGIINLGIFVLLDVVDANKNSVEVNAFAGLGRKNPFLGLCGVVLAIALVGLPPTVGFTGKLLIFTALWDAYQTQGDSFLLYLLIFGLVNAVVSLFYYLKIPYEMFFKENTDNEILDFSLNQQLLLGTLTMLTIILFFQPNLLMDVIAVL